MPAPPGRRWCAAVAPQLSRPLAHSLRTQQGSALHLLLPCRPCLLHHCSSAGQASHLRMWQSRAIATSAPPALEHHHSTPLHRATVLSNRREALGLHVMLLDVGAQLAALHKRPGQYLQAQLAPSDAQAGFFAITSPPGGALPAGVVELLVKAQPGAVAERICALPPGAQLWVSPPQVCDMMEPCGGEARCCSLPGSSRRSKWWFRCHRGRASRWSASLRRTWTRCCCLPRAQVSAPSRCAVALGVGDGALLPPPAP